MSTLASVVIRDLMANRPAPGIPGRLFFASDTGAQQRDNGTAWDPVLNEAQSIAPDSNKFLISFDASTGLFAAAQPADADLSLTDVTTNDVSSAAHGFAPRLPGDATKFLNGTGVYSVPPGSGISKYTASWSVQTSVTVTHGLGTTAVIVQVFDSSGIQVQPESITVTSPDVVTLAFGSAFTGLVVVIG